MENDNFDLKTLILSWLNPSIGIILTPLSIYITFFSDNAKQNKGTIIWIVLLTLIAFILFLLFGLYSYNQNKYVRLKNKKQIIDRIKDYANDKNYPSIVLFGSFDNEIIGIVKNSYGPTTHTNTLKVITSNFNVYNKLNIESKSFLFKEECENSDDVFSHKFLRDKQAINIFVASNNNCQSKYILFWESGCNRGGHMGIEINNKQININLNDLFQSSVSMNLEEQNGIICDTISDYNTLWEPLKYGSFKPVMPNIADNNIRLEWRKQILKEFNKKANELIKDQEYHKVDVTWNITMESSKDLVNFKEWIENQISLSKEDGVEISRYILLNEEAYFNQEKLEYKEIVNQIWDYLTMAKGYNNTSYNLKIISSAKLLRGDVGDYAMLRKDDLSDAIVQGSIIDDFADPFVLKTYFSKSFDEVQRIKEKFDRIKCGGIKKYSTLQEFENSVML